MERHLVRVHLLDCAQETFSPLWARWVSARARLPRQEKGPSQPQRQRSTSPTRLRRQGVQPASKDVSQSPQLTHLPRRAPLSISLTSCDAVRLCDCDGFMMLHAWVRSHVTQAVSHTLKTPNITFCVHPHESAAAVFSFGFAASKVTTSSRQNWFTPPSVVRVQPCNQAAQQAYKRRAVCRSCLLFRMELPADSR